MASRWITVPVMGFAFYCCANGGAHAPVREFSGVWLYEFEGSTFIEGIDQAPPARPAFRVADWLTWYSQPRLEAFMGESGYDEARNCHLVKPVRLTFVGHRTYYPLFGAGHLSGWRSDVTVHRVISAESLGPAYCLESRAP